MLNENCYVRHTFFFDIPLMNMVIYTTVFFRYLANEYMVMCALYFSSQLTNEYGNSNHIFYGHPPHEYGDVYDIFSPTSQ